MKTSITAHKKDENHTFNNLDELVEFLLENDGYTYSVMFTRTSHPDPAHSPRMMNFMRDHSDTIICDFHYRAFTIQMDVTTANLLVVNEMALENVITGLDHMEITMDHMELLGERLY